jgi:hypothetical protein
LTCPASSSFRGPAFPPECRISGLAFGFAFAQVDPRTDRCRKAGSVGDRIHFTAPDKPLGVASRDLAAVESAAPDGGISARLDNGRQIEFYSKEHRHFDHGYAITSHSSQWLTAERVLVNADTGVHPGLLNSRFAYVSISRASPEATLITDKMNMLNPQLSSDVSKSSAPECELGWVKAGKTRQEPSFVSNEELAEASVSQFLNLIRRLA